MKKIVLLFVCLAFFCASFDVSACKSSEYWDSENADIAAGIQDCIEKGSSTLSNADGDLNLVSGDGFRSKINDLIQNISTILGLLAVASLVYGGYLMVFSGGEEEGIKKGKDIVKWSLIGFLGLIFASSIIYLIVNTFYNL